MTTPTRGGRPSATPSRTTRRQKQEEAAAREAAERQTRVRHFRIAGVAVTAIVAVAFGLTLVVTHGSGSGNDTGTRGVATSTDPSGFDLPRLDGNGDVRLATFRGKPTVVNFFASWCTACRGELPGFARVSRALQNQVTFVGVNSLETGDGAAMARQFGIDWWPIARDVDGQQASGLHDALGGQGMPITAFYDAGGKLVFVSPGSLPEPDLRAALQRYFGVG